MEQQAGIMAMEIVVYHKWIMSKNFSLETLRIEQSLVTFQIQLCSGNHFILIIVKIQQ